MTREKIEEGLQRMKMLRDGGMVDCPFCKKGKICKKNDAVFLCDKCGRGIVGRVYLKS